MKAGARGPEPHRGPVLSQPDGSAPLTPALAISLPQTLDTQDPAGIESFRKQVYRVVVGLALAVTMVSSLLAYRLAVHMTALRDAQRLADELEERLSTRTGTPELSPPHAEIDIGGASVVPSDRLAEASNRRWTIDWGIQKSGAVHTLWASAHAGGVLLERIERDADPWTARDRRTVLLRIAVGGGFLAWLAVWSGILLTHRVVLRLRDSRQALVHIATHDGLTGLPNRYEFESTVQRAIASRQFGWIALLDLDSFKEVNDTLGHRTGDDLLVILARRAVAVVGDAGLVARLGGDELAIWLPASSSADALRLMSELTEAFARPVFLSGCKIVSSASMGLCSYPDHANTLATLLAYGDAAMYESKRRRAGPVIYLPEFSLSSVDQLTLRSELQMALDERVLQVHYMPKKCLQTGRWTGVEALARWNHPVRGWIPPAEFVEVAERTGLIHQLSDQVFLLAAEQARRFADLGIQCPIAVNLSPMLCSDESLPERLLGPLRARGLGAEAFEIELTESTAWMDKTRARGLLDNLADLGFVLALDDFGTGMSSLSYLSELPFHIVKVDRSFVLALDQATDVRAARGLVEATISLAHHLDLRVVAEGVESERIERTLAAMGCDYCQGFGVQKPVSGTKIEELLLIHGVCVQSTSGPAVETA